VMCLLSLARGLALVLLLTGKAVAVDAFVSANRLHQRPRLSTILMWYGVMEHTRYKRFSVLDRLIAS
jgi:hypothetical protein